jgi:hypothetical protein
MPYTMFQVEIYHLHAGMSLREAAYHLVTNAARHRTRFLCAAIDAKHLHDLVLVS